MQHCIAGFEPDLTPSPCSKWCQQPNTKHAPCCDYNKSRLWSDVERFVKSQDFAEIEIFIDAFLTGNLRQASLNAFLKRYPHHHNQYEVNVHRENLAERVAKHVVNKDRATHIQVRRWARLEKDKMQSKMRYKERAKRESQLTQKLDKWQESFG